MEQRNIFPGRVISSVRFSTVERRVVEFVPNTLSRTVSRITAWLSFEAIL